MHTVFSHIIQKRFSQVNEDVATDALAYVLESSEAARRGMTRLIRGLIPDLPQLRFKTQQTEGSIRPDMWGFAHTEPRVFVENKFWAGLTDNQPVSYLEQLATYSQPTALLVVGPAAREHTLWRELNRRLGDAGISLSKRDAASGISWSATTQIGPIIALTSWTRLLSVLEHETADDPGARGDLVQLRALCNSADNEAFTPASSEELTDQRTPAFILRLNSIVQAAVAAAVEKNILSITGLRPQSSWDRIGRYVWVSGNDGAGAWLGIHFELWRSHGATPLWMFFHDGDDFGRAQEVRRLIEPWAARHEAQTVSGDSYFAIALDVPAGEEKAGVVRSLIDDFREIAAVLKVLPPRIRKNAKED